jgi:hypothetical protein
MPVAEMVHTYVAAMRAPARLVIWAAARAHSHGGGGVSKP